MSDALSAAMVRLMEFAADTGTFTPAVGSPVACQVRVDKAELEDPDNYDLRYAGTEYRLMVLLSEVGKEPVSGDIFTVGATSYQVTAPVDKNNLFITLAAKVVS